MSASYRASLLTGGLAGLTLALLSYSAINGVPPDLDSPQDELADRNGITASSLSRRLPAFFTRWFPGYHNLSTLDLSDTQVSIPPEKWLSPSLTFTQEKSDIKEDLATQELMKTAYGSVKRIDASRRIFRYSAAKHVFLVNANLESADFDGASLEGASFQSAYLPKASFRNTDLEEGQFQFAFGQLAHFEHADLKGARFFEADCDGAHFEAAQLGVTDYSGALIDPNSNHGADFCNASLRNTQFQEAQLQAACFFHADLFKANLAHADLRKADMTEATLYLANLAHADLRAANLDKAELQGADLSGADLTGANLKDAILTDYIDPLTHQATPTKISLAQLLQANGIDEADLPPVLQAALDRRNESADRPKHATQKRPVPRP